MYYVKFIKEYEDSSELGFQFYEQTTVESMLLSFLEKTNSKITLDASVIYIFLEC